MGGQVTINILDCKWFLFLLNVDAKEQTQS